MSDPIDRGPLMVRLTDAFDYSKGRDDAYYHGMREGLRFAISRLASAPKVEQPEIVRCFNCTSWDGFSGDCRFGRINGNPYAYCSFGERRRE